MLDLLLASYIIFSPFFLCKASFISHQHVLVLLYVLKCSIIFFKCSIPMILANTFLNDIFFLFYKTSPKPTKIQKWDKQTNEQSRNVFEDLQVWNKVRLSTTEYKSSYWLKKIFNIRFELSNHSLFNFCWIFFSIIVGCLFFYNILGQVGLNNK